MGKKSSQGAAPTSVEYTPPPPSISLSFDDRMKVPANFGNLSIGDRVIVQVSGKVIRLDESQTSEPKKGIRQSLEVEMTGVQIVESGPKDLKQARSAAMSAAENFDKRKK
jgi:hypothetical protein